MNDGWFKKEMGKQARLRLVESFLTPENSKLFESVLEQYDQGLISYEEQKIKINEIAKDLLCQTHSLKKD